MEVAVCLCVSACIVSSLWYVPIEEGSGTGAFNLVDGTRFTEKEKREDKKRGRLGDAIERRWLHVGSQDGLKLGRVGGEGANPLC